MVYDTDNGPVDNAQIPILYGLPEPAMTVTPSSPTRITSKNGILLVTHGLSTPTGTNCAGTLCRVLICVTYVQTISSSPVVHPYPKRKTAYGPASSVGDTGAELDANLAGLRNDGFPTDGAMLDVNWFGNVTKGSENSHGKSRMGHFQFPNPTEKIASLKAAGIGVILLRNPTLPKVCQSTLIWPPGKLALVRSGLPTCSPVYLTGQ